MLFYAHLRETTLIHRKERNLIRITHADHRHSHPLWHSQDGVKLSNLT